ncbi:MAG: hypothetical protein V4519_02665 [Patescibacteria group bacterium]
MFKRFLILSGILSLPAIALLIYSNVQVSQVQADDSVYSTNNYNNVGIYYVFVAPDSYYKNQGEHVSFNGHNFYPGETVHVTMNGTSLGTVQANSSGHIATGSYMLPYSAGTKTFMFKGDMSNIAYNVDVAVSGGHAWIVLSNYYTGVGSLIHVQGNAFGSNETVTVWFDGMNMGTAQANAQGQFSHTITVPNTGAGQKTIMVKGSQTGITASQGFSQAF